MPTFEYKADAATPCLTLIPAPVTLEYTHGTAMIGSLVTIEKRIPEYAVTEDADETWETLPIEQLSSELERYCGVAVRTRRVLTATDEADAGANAAEKARDAGVGAGAGAGAPAAMNGTVISLCVDARLAHDEYTLDVFASDTIAVRGWQRKRIAVRHADTAADDQANLADLALPAYPRQACVRGARLQS